MSSGERSTRTSRRRWLLAVTLFLLSNLVTALLSNYVDLLSLVAKSLFIFIPGMLIVAFIDAVRSHVDDYQKHRRRGDLLVIVFLGLGIGFFLLLIGWFLKSLN